MNKHILYLNYIFLHKVDCQSFHLLALICLCFAFCRLESAILISPIARFDFDNSRSTRENRLYLKCSIYIRDRCVIYYFARSVRYTYKTHRFKVKEWHLAIDINIFVWIKKKKVLLLKLISNFFFVKIYFWNFN